MPNAQARETEEPLGILLRLVEQGKLEVTGISVAKITANYLESIADLKGHTPEEISEFLQLGARLLYIKSLALLPKGETDEQSQELRKLNLELEEYHRMQSASRLLAALAQTPTWARGATTSLAPEDMPIPNIDLAQLSAVFQSALAKAEPEPEKASIKPHLSLQSVVKKLKLRLAKGSFDLESVLAECRHRVELIVTFLAVLEIIKQGAAKVSQDRQFSSITIEGPSV